MAVPVNQDLTRSNKRPGVYVQLLLNSAGSGDDFEPNTLLLLGERDPSTATKAPDALFDLSSEQDASDWFGPRSTVRRMYRAAVAQVGEGNIRVKAVGVAPAPGGVASIYQLVVSTPASAGGATAAGQLRAQVCGDEVAISYASGDSASTIAQALYNQLILLQFCPCTFSLNGATITIIYNVVGAVGEDLPLRFFINDKQDTGVYVGPGTITIASNAVGNGTLQVIMGSQTVSVALTNGNQPNTIAQALLSAFNGGDYFCDLLKSVVAGGPPATLPLYYRSGRDIRRMSAKVITSTGTTVQLPGGLATDGTGSASSVSYAGTGTPGSGGPSLTNALSNISAAGSFGEWVCPWTDSSTLGAIATQIENDGNGEQQKNQHLTVCLIGTEAAGAGIPGATSPALSSSLRYVLGFCPDAGQQGYELAARRAAMIAAWLTPATNSDGLPFKTTARIPMNLPAQAVRPTPGTIKAALLDGLEPWVVVAGRLQVERGRNASNASDDVLWDPSYIRQYGFYRRDLRTDGQATFGSTFIKADGRIDQPNQVTIASVTAWAIGKLSQWEKVGVYDGAVQLAPDVRVQINPGDRSRVDLVVPASPIIPLHQLGIVAARTAPAL